MNNLQKIHWHFRYDDPYGTYYDTNQHFAPHVTVHNEGQFKSILRIKNFTPDDFGTYRCLSSAILPEDGAFFGGFGYRKKRSVFGYYPTPGPTLPSPGASLPRVNAPFFRPNVGLFGVFLEVKFSAEVGSMGRWNGGYLGALKDGKNGTDLPNKEF